MKTGKTIQRHYARGYAAGFAAGKKVSPPSVRTVFLPVIGMFLGALLAVLSGFVK